MIAVSIVVDFFRARLLYRVAAETSSEALEADALHFGSDMWSSIAVLIGLGAVALGYPWADSAAAVVVAVFICIAGWRLGRRTVDTLTDTAPAGVADKIRAHRRARCRAWSRSTACGCGRPATCCSSISTSRVSRTLPLDRVAAIKERVEAAVRARIPQGRDHRQHRAARARRRDRDGARDGDRAQPRARRASRHRACHRRTAVGLARSRSRRQPVARARARNRRRPRSRRCATSSAPRSRSRPISSRCRSSGLAGRDAPARARARRCGRRSRSSPPTPGSCATCTTCACARPPTARSSISTAMSIPALTRRRGAREGRRTRTRAAARFPSIKRVIGHAEPRR